MEASQMLVEGEVVNGSALVAVPKETAVELHRHATDVAAVCKEIVTRTAVGIQGRKFVKCEGWMSIANAYGLVASARDVEAVVGGIRAIGELRRMSDGAVVATAEGFIGEDEVVWYGGVDEKGKTHTKRPEYARRAMVQTRAISRACRSALAFVVVLMDAGLSTTPAEEVPDGGFNDSSKPIPAPLGVDKLRAQISRPMAAPAASVVERLKKLAEPVDARPSPPPHTELPYGDHNGEVTLPEDANCPPYGHGKGKKLSDLDLGQLQFYESGCQRTLADPSKSKFHQKETALLATIRAWISFRG